jgi:hypothetical protein
MQNLTFEEGKTYVDREGNKYVFIERRAGVTIFKNLDTNKHAVKNLNGQYRWDNKEDDRDIIGVIDE